MSKKGYTDCFGVVYIITNAINGKVYIGKTTKTIRTRLKWHISYANQGYDFLLCRAIRKYGAENFSIKILAEAQSREDLNKLEIEYIAKYGAYLTNQGYNATLGGDGLHGAVGETGKRAESKMKGKKLSTEHKEKICAGMTPEVKEQIRLANIGRFVRSVCKKGHEMSDENVYIDYMKKRHCRKCRHDTSIRFADRQKKGLPLLSPFISESLKGRVFSQEHLDAIGEGVVKAFKLRTQCTSQ